MQRILMAAACLLVTAITFGQTDTANVKPDTLTVGNFIIVKKKTGTLVSDNNNRDAIGYEYRSNRSYNRRYYSYEGFAEIPVVSRVVNNIVDAALNISDYFSRSYAYDYSYLNHYNYKTKSYKIKKGKKQSRIIKINGDRYMIDASDTKDSD